EKWEEFRQRYVRELKDNEEQLALVQQAMKQGTVTLLYSAKDHELNNAVVLHEFLNDQSA
ncbi:MAG: DUF488 family protein, partial [Caldilineaceae bacterium]|nr:DUF488 family protein [Caldilineaceae bacterium]